MEKIALKVKDLWFGFKNWVKENPKEAAILTLILLVGAFLRLYKISQYMTFLGDEGRDVIIVRRLLAYGDFFLIGPGTSIGEMYLGPLYYYMMAPALFLAGFSPVGPAIQIALLGVVTIALVYFIGKEWFGKWGAALGAFLYAISPTLIIYSRSSWNPNIMPFFALACIYSLWRIWRARQWKWVIVLGISFAFVLQSHYLGLLLAPTIGLFWLLTFLKEKRKGFGTKEFIKRNNEFTVNIALIDRTRPVLGVVHAPALDVTYSATTDTGAFKLTEAGRQQITVSGQYNGQLKIVASRSHGNAAVEQFINKFPDALFMAKGSSLKFCLVAEGSAHLYPRFGPTMEWDTAAAQCVVECAGGTVTDIQGIALKYNKPDLHNPFFVVSGLKDFPWQS